MFIEFEYRSEANTFFRKSYKRSEANWFIFIFKLDNIEVKRTSSIVILNLKNGKSELSFFYKRKAKNEKVR